MMLRTCRLSNKFVSVFSKELSRNYASVSATPVVVTKSKTGITVVSVQDSTPASSVAVVVKAGSRAETADNVGAAHFLKNFAFKSTSTKTAFRTTREAELLGGILSANLTRETLIISAEFLREDLTHFMETLSDIIFKTSYHPYEFPDINKNVLFERNAASTVPEVTVLDAAHSVAFRHGLGNSLFADAATKVTSSAAVSAFANKVYTAPNITVIGTSVDPVELSKLTDELFQNISHTIPQTPTASKYYGGEYRIPAPGDSHFVLAFPGAPMGTSDYATFQVLRSLIDGEKHTKWGEGANVLAQTASKLNDIQINAFNTGYSDAGLFGIYISGIATDVYSAARVAVEQLKHVAKSISKEDFDRALAKARYNTAASYETRASKTEIFGSQILASGKITTVTDAIAQFDHVKAEDVQNIAAKVIRCKPTAVALGDVSKLPYSDGLSL